MDHWWGGASKILLCRSATATLLELRRFTLRTLHFHDGCGIDPYLVASSMHIYHSMSAHKLWQEKTQYLGKLNNRKTVSILRLIKHLNKIVEGQNSLYLFFDHDAFYFEKFNFNYWLCIPSLYRSTNFYGKSY